jgi:hypothetical protein
MKNVLRFLISILQLILLYISYYFFLLFKKYIKKSKFVIGTHEIANNIYYIGKILDNSLTVCLKKNKFYSQKYDYFIKTKNEYYEFIYRIFYGPILFGYLINKGDIFFYIWTEGFLLDRKNDFKFLKLKNKKIICLFVGNDIKSIKLKIELAKSKNLDCAENYYEKLFFDESYDKKKKYIATLADTYADLIFCSRENISYLKSKTYPWRLHCDQKFFNKNDNKFKLKKIKILHAPSSPIIKGTPLVRAAIKKLEAEGYDFDYIELLNIKNEKILEYLNFSHVVLNQFYAYSPGLFGIESMASNCAVLMSADPDYYTVPKDNKDAWVFTKYWQIYDNLKHLLDNPKKIKYYADNGYEYACKNYSQEAASSHLNQILKINNIA